MIIKEELRLNPGPPGKYYPFKPPIKKGSPLYQLLERKKPEVLPRMSFATSATQRGSPGRARGYASSARCAMGVVPKHMTGALVREVRW
jgi:hypothetical protein